MGKKEEFEEIYNTLKGVAEFRRQPILESELREMAKRLFEYRSGPELYRVIMAISTATYFPASFDLEQQVRAAKGLKPLKGLTEELIAKNERELVVSGQSPAEAAQGAEMMRKTLRSKEPLPEKTQEQADAASAEMATPALAARTEKLLALADPLIFTFGPMNAEDLLGGWDDEENSLDLGEF